MILCTGKEIFLVQGGLRRSIPDWDTFVSLKLPGIETIDSLLNFFEIGDPLPKCTSC